MLPHVEVVLSLLSSGLIPSLRPGRIHVAAVKEGTAGFSTSELLSWLWASIGSSSWHALSSHQLWRRHLECCSKRLTKSGLHRVIIERVMIAHSWSRVSSWVCPRVHSSVSSRLRSRVSPRVHGITLSACKEHGSDLHDFHFFLISVIKVIMDENQAA